MRAEEKMQSWLIACKPLVAEVGDRIEAVERAQAQLTPNVVFRRTGTVPERDLCGDTGFSLVAVTVEVESESWSEVRAVAKIIRKCLKKKALLIHFDDDVDNDSEPKVYYYTQTFQLSEMEEI